MMKRLFLLFALFCSNAFAIDLMPTKATVFVSAYYKENTLALNNATPGIGLSWGGSHGLTLGAYRNAYRTNTYYVGYAKSWQPAQYLVLGVAGGVYRNESREGVHGFLVPYVGVPVGRFVPKLSYARKACHRCTDTLSFSVDYLF